MSGDLIRIPAPYLQEVSGYQTSEMQKYPHAYQTPDGRWLIQRAYGYCGGGWQVIDTTGQCRIGWDIIDTTGRCWTELVIVRTLEAAKAYLSEWAVAR